MAQAAPVQFIQGLGGRDLRVEGVWCFHFVTEYDQVVLVDALVVEGCHGELLLGNDCLEQHRAVIDYGTKEAVYQDGDLQVILPFSCFRGGATSAVRLARGKKLPTQAQTMLRLPVRAADGEVGIFEPAATSKNSSLLLPAVVAVVRGGSVSVPVLNVLGKRSKLPARHVLGTWVPLDETMTLLESKGELNRERVLTWLREIQREDGRENVDTAPAKLDHLIEDERELMRVVLQAFPQVTTKQEVCPPMNKTGVRHYTPTGKAVPVYGATRSRRTK